MSARNDLQIYSDSSSQPNSEEDDNGSGSSASSSSYEERMTTPTVSYLDMLLKVSSEVDDGSEVQAKVKDDKSPNDHMNFGDDEKTPKHNNLGFWDNEDDNGHEANGDDVDMSSAAFEAEMISLETFLNCHHKKRLITTSCTDDNSHHQRVEVKKNVEMDTEDYVNYMQLNGSSTNAIRQTFLYCLRTDDVRLAELLLRDVGIEFILRHCMLFDGIFHVGSSSSTSTPSTSKSSSAKISETSTANMFWLAALHGSNEVLNLVSEECLIYFIEAYIGGDMDDSDCCEEVPEEVVEKARADLTSILNDDVSVCDCLPLYVAAAKNHAGVIATLLKFGTNPNGTCQGNKSAAIVAASKNNLLALQALGESDTIDFNWTDDHSLTPLLAACRNGCVDAVRYLVHYVGGRGDPQKHQQQQNSVNCSRQDLKGYGCTSLAARYNRAEVVQFLCQVHSPHSKELGGSGIDINQRNRYDEEIALHVAAKHNCREVVRSFLEMIPCDCDIVARNQHHMTALHIAASRGHAGIVTEFVSSVSTDIISELDTHDNFGMTPLFYAIFKGYTDCVKLLGPFSDVNKLCYAPVPKRGSSMHNNGGGEDSNAPGKSRSNSLLQPPLVFASSRGHVDIVVTLLHCQADPNLPDVRGNMALTVAAEEGHFEVVEILMNQGIDVRSKVGKVAIHKARKNKHIEIVDYLEKCIPR